MEQGGVCGIHMLLDSIQRLDDFQWALDLLHFRLDELGQEIFPTSRLIHEFWKGHHDRMVRNLMRVTASTTATKQTSKQASKRKTKHMVSLMMFKASIYSNQFLRLLSSLSLSLSLAVYFFCFDVYLQTLLMASVHHLNLSAAKCAFVDFFATWSSSQFSA